MEEQDVSKQYLQGFNHGYYMQQFKPELSKQISENSKGDTEYLDGFKAGGEQYQKEQPREMQSLKSVNKNKWKDKGIEPGL